ncbi:MAG TPA: hypothetical protein VK837_08635 [Longimicrobiales bacterium]|nr:hypothetical protein [Longimicrobiales bacterium]
MHLDDGRIQALLHGELTADDVERSSRHVETCPSCQARVESARREEREIFAALRALDAPLPARTASDVEAEARRAEPARRTVRIVWRVAASLLVLFGAAGVAYALPGSPLREAFQRWLESPPPPVELPAVGADDPAGGVAVRPEGRFTVRFEAPQPGDTVWVRVVDDSLLAARADAEASFVSVPRGIVIRSTAPNLYRVTVPEASTDVRIEAGSRVVAVVRRGVLEVDGVAAPGGEAAISLAP